MLHATRILTYMGAVAVSLCILPATIRADLLIYHFDVGMGDATLIVDSQSKRSLLIDAGNRGIGKKILAPALKELGYTKINYFIATHYDADHIGGFDEIVAEGISISDAVYDRGDHTHRKELTPTDRKTQYGEYLETARQLGRKTLEPNCFSDLKLGADTHISVITVGGKFLKWDCTRGTEPIREDKDNDLSISIVVRHGKFSYFIGGDLTGGGGNTTAMEGLISATVGDIDVLRLNHHGSHTSSSEKFLNALSPEVAIISVGNGRANLRYGLPKQKVLNRLADLEPRPLLFLTNRGEGGTYKGAFIETGQDIVVGDMPKFQRRHVILHTNGNSYSINGIVRMVDNRRSEDAQ